MVSEALISELVEDPATGRPLAESPGDAAAVRRHCMLVLCACFDPDLRPEAYDPSQGPPSLQWMVGGTKVFGKDTVVRDLRAWQQQLVIGQVQHYAVACVARCKFAAWRVAYKARKYAFMKKDAERVQALARAAIAHVAVAYAREGEARRAEIEAEAERARQEEERRKREDAERYEREREARERAAAEAEAARVRAEAAAAAERVRLGKMLGSAITIQAWARRLGAKAYVAQMLREARALEARKARLRALARAAAAQLHLIELHRAALARAEAARSICALFRAVIAKGVLQMMRVKEEERVNAAVLIGAFLDGIIVKHEMLEWAQEVDAACINGKHSTVARLLMRTDPEYTRIHSFFLADVVDVRNSVTGQAFAHSASKAGCATTLENLATAGATFDVTDFTGNTPLHYAAAGGDASLAAAIAADETARA